MRTLVKSSVLMFGALGTSLLRADQFHWNNLVVGERAMGLGGAFCAVADDASAIIYNPAGIAFALSNDVTGSANAFYKKQVTYKKALGTKDFVERSGGTLAPFFGGMQKMDSLTKGLAFAFGLYTIDSELKDQDDTISNLGSLDRFHRTANIRSSTTGAGAAVAKRFGSNFSAGLSLSVITIDELVQEYQDVSYTNQSYLSQNFRTQLSGSGLDAGLGVQYALGTWSLGLVVKLRHLLSDSYDVGLDRRTNRDDTGNPGTIEVSQVDQKIEGALGALPTEVRAGVAWFPTTDLLWTFDLIYEGQAKSEKLPTIYNRQAVTNFATGAEYYITPSIPLRVGTFTNYDARPKLVKGKTGQLDHVDYLGQTLFLGWVQPNSQVAGGLIYQGGKGEAQKVQSEKIQTVEAQSYTFAISATHSF